MLHRRNAVRRRLAPLVVCGRVVCRLIWILPPLFSPSVFFAPVLVPSALGSPAPTLAVKSAQDKASATDNDKALPQPLALRWSEDLPGCTFSRGDDGKYRYGLWSGDVGVVLAVDAREVQLARIHNPNRNDPIFAVLLEIHYRGGASLHAGPERITLQFVKHFKVVQPALDPDGYSERIQADADALDDETRREVKKRPEKQASREAGLQEYQRRTDELIEFLATKSLRPAHLDRANPEVSGWVFFSTNSKWLGRWKAQEEFILRLPVDGKIFEFPFKLPPEKGELLLQKRQ
jgi:hypothetical protein